MFTVYFNAKQERGRWLSPAEIKASDALNVGMLEEVTEEGLCSWHDIPTEADVQTVRAWIAGNLGNYSVDVARETYNDGAYCTEENVETGVKCIPQADPAPFSGFGAILCANGRVEVTETRGGIVVNWTRYNSMEEACSWSAWKVANETGKCPADVEAVPVKVAPGVYDIKVTML